MMHLFVKHIWSYKTIKKILRSLIQFPQDLAIWQLWKILQIWPQGTKFNVLSNSQVFRKILSFAQLSY